MATILNLLECSDRVTARHAKGKFTVANIDTVDVLHILRQFDSIAGSILPACTYSGRQIEPKRLGSGYKPEPAVNRNV